MIPELGHLALVLALMMALVQSLWPLYGLAAGRPIYMRLAAPAALGQFLMLGVAFASLAWAFYVNDFNKYGKEYQVILQADAPFRMEEEEIE